MKIKWGVAVALLLLLGPVNGGHAADGGNYLYRVTTLRAAPGALLGLIDYLKGDTAAAAYAARRQQRPMVMRHSQGDQWDLLLLQPVASYAAYFAHQGATRRDNPVAARIDELTVFREDLFAFGPPAEATRQAFAENAFFHIEMFAALPGKHAELLAQRVMENRYARAIERPANLIWVGDLGSDVDVFTIGFYPSLAAFAAPSPVAGEAREQAAVEAGFKGRDFIGSYLRELIAAHHDTLAVKVE